jgi:hypothetical protein
MNPTLWKFKCTGHKHLNSIKVPGLRVANWPGQSIVGHGIGYGVMHGAVDARKNTIAAGYHYLYADGPFFLARKSDSHRLVWDGYWWNGKGPDRRAKLKDVGCVIRPWKQGAHVLLSPISAFFNSCVGSESVDDWAERVSNEIRRYTDRKIVLRFKSSPAVGMDERLKAMDKALESAWAVVTNYSTMAIEAICRGVPAFTTQPDATLALACPDLSQIESPWMPDGREEWAQNMAARQFSHAQMASGEAWRHCEEDLQEIMKQ